MEYFRGVVVRSMRDWRGPLRVVAIGGGELVILAWQLDPEVRVALDGSVRAWVEVERGFWGRRAAVWFPRTAPQADDGPIGFMPTRPVPFVEAIEAAGVPVHRPERPGPG